MEYDYLSLMAYRLEGKESHVPSSYGSKPKVKEIAALLGIRTPEVYFEGAVSQLPWEDLPNEFVLKPTFASTNIGVMLLEKLDTSQFKNLFSDEVISMEEIIEKCGEVSRKYFDGDSDAGTFLVEELLRADDGTTPPPDIRAFSFFGKVGMVQVESHVPGQVASSAYFDGDFEPFEDREERYGVADGAQPPQEIDDSIEQPSMAGALLRTAERVSAAVPSSFCRVGMYQANGRVPWGDHVLPWRFLL